MASYTPHLPWRTECATWPPLEVRRPPWFHLGLVGGGFSAGHAIAVMLCFLGCPVLGKNPDGPCGTLSAQRPQRLSQAGGDLAV